MYVGDASMMVSVMSIVSQVAGDGVSLLFEHGLGSVARRAQCFVEMGSRVRRLV